MNFLEILQFGQNINRCKFLNISSNLPFQIITLIVSINNQQHQSCYIVINSIMQEQDHIFTTSFPFQNEFQHRTGLCLNPQCPNFNRICITVKNVFHNYDVGNNHHNCGGWILTLPNENNDFKQQLDSEETTQNFDFLTNPITSIKHLNKYSQINWKNDLKNIFQTIKKELNTKLTTVFESTCQKIGSFLNKNNKIGKKINQLSKLTQGKKWSLKQQHIYQQIIEDLKQIQKTGLLKVMNNDALKRQIDSMLIDISRLQWSFWVTESQIDRQNRQKTVSNNSKLEQLKQTSTMQQINKSLQQIHSALKLKPFSFKQKESQIYIECGKCNIQIKSQGKNKQIKRSECLDKLLKHFCNDHSQQIIEKVIQKKNIICLKITFQKFLQQICSNNYKTFVIIDRQNISKAHGQVIISDGVYTLQVVSKGHQNLATGKYLVAQSNGKDAADILIIIMLYQLVRTNPLSRKILLTNDHFGKTLQQIFQEHGAEILLQRKSNSQMLKQINNQIECIIID